MDPQLHKPAIDGTSDNPPEVGESRSQDPPRDLSGTKESYPTRSEIDQRLKVLLPLKICRVITRLNIGGPSVQATLLTSKLSPPAFQSVLVSGIEDEREGNYLDLIEPEKRQELPLEIIETLSRAPRPTTDLATLAKLVTLLRRLRPDIVHTHMAKAGTLGRIAAHLTGVPIVIHTFHGNTFEGYFSPAVSAAVRAWETVLASMSDCVIAITPSQIEELASAGISRKKIRLVPLGIPLDRFDEIPPKRAARQAFGVPETALCIGWVARLVPIKDPLLMVEAVGAIAAHKSSKVVLLVAGDGPLREQVVELGGKLGVEIRLVGWQRDLAMLYAACDVVALSSKNEGFPVALVEAIASRRPVASTDVGGVAELFATAGQGVLAQKRTADHLAEAILEAVETPKAQLEVSARLVKDAYGEERLVSDISMLYKELAFAKAEQLQRRRAKTP
ncbi:MAG: hypothetical protein C4319_05185 [Acidimicrobiia bacterium]